MERNQRTCTCDHALIPVPSPKGEGCLLVEAGDLTPVPSSKGEGRLLVDIDALSLAALGDFADLRVAQVML